MALASLLTHEVKPAHEADALVQGPALTSVKTAIVGS